MFKIKKIVDNHSLFGVIDIIMKKLIIIKKNFIFLKLVLLVQMNIQVI